MPRSGGDACPALRALVVDGDADGRAALVRALTSISEVGKVHVAADAAQALRLLHEARMDVMFVYTELPGIDGFDLARIVGQFATPPAVVVIADDRARAIDAFDVGAIDFVARTVGPSRLAESLRRVQRFGPRVSGEAALPAAGWEANPASIVAVDVMGESGDLPVSAVRWIEAQGNYVRVHTATGSHLVAGPLATFIQDWAVAGIIRIHRSYGVQVSAITEFRRLGRSYTVVVGGRELPISRRSVGVVKERLLGRAAEVGRTAQQASPRATAAVA